MARISSILLNESDESGHPCIVPDLKRKAFSLSLSMILAVDMSYMAIIILGYLPLLIFCCCC